jgi:hypothetical protein
MDGQHELSPQGLTIERTKPFAVMASKSPPEVPKRISICGEYGDFWQAHV